jgi:hypothetical protein
MEQYLPGIVQAIVIGVITLIAVYFVNSIRAKKEVAPSFKGATRNKQDTVRAPSGTDFGMIAGSYAIFFFAAAIFEALFAFIKLGPNDMIGLIVVLDLLTVIAWVRRTDYKLMRGIATLFAVAATGLVLLILRKHLHL